MSKVCRLLFLAPVVLALFLCGCQTANDHQIKKDSVAMVPPKVETPEFIFHKVYAGETLATIAKWYTGKTSKWRDIADENPGLNPWNLKAGDIVKVSLSLATVHTEQPPYSTKPRGTAKKSSKGAAPQDDAEQEEAFGPK
mgnify:CR=1 FL=1